MRPLSPEWAYWSVMNGVPALVATAAFLFYPPFQKMFAWDVRDRQRGIFLGTGFLLRAALFVTVLTAKSWGEIRWLTWGNAAFAAVLLGVTLIWGDLFQWNHLIANIWLFLYIEEPVWMLTLVPAAQAAASGVVPRSSRRCSCSVRNSICAAVRFRVTPQLQRYYGWRCLASISRKDKSNPRQSFLVLPTRNGDML